MNSWTRELLRSDGDASALVRRAAIGLGLASLYGLALGVRTGGFDLLWSALGVPAAIAAVALLGLPALYIVLALFDAPLSPHKAGGAAAIGIASGGLVLAGLAPLAALYVVTTGSGDAASSAGAVGLAVGGALGLRHLTAALRDALHEADNGTRFMATIAQSGFGLFAILLAWRIWHSLLSVIGGAS